MGLNVYDWKERKLIQKIDLGMEGVMPLEIRFLHDPKATEGFVGSALFAKMYRFYKTDAGDWAAEKVIDIPNKEVDGWILPEMPGVMTDILISMDDKYLYFSNWLHGDIRQYDITDTRSPSDAAAQFGRQEAVRDHLPLLPLDKQFYPEMCNKGSMMFIIDVDTVNGGMQLNPDFMVDFGAEPGGPVLAHEIRYPGGDCTSDIYVADMEKKIQPVRYH